MINWVNLWMIGLDNHFVRYVFIVYCQGLKHVKIYLK